MLQLTRDRTREILADPAFKELVSARARLRWSFSIVTLIMFFGFIALISAARCAQRDCRGKPHAARASTGALMIVLVVFLTGLCVQRCNSRFDERARALNRQFGQ
jgi:uncharacterized membrane protein (DUF485 family)